jgi:DNA-binding NtrC family response regulator
MSNPDAISKQTRGWVLVADDSESIRTRLRALVARIGGVSGVETASHAREAMACLERLEPAAALVDVHLEGAGVGDLLRRMKTRRPDMALIAMTLYAGEPVSATYQAQGADCCFDKVSEMDTMLRAVELFVKQQATPDSKENAT